MDLKWCSLSLLSIPEIYGLMMKQPNVLLYTQSNYVMFV